MQRRRACRGAATEADLARAKAFLASDVAVVGLAEHFAESVDMFSRALLGRPAAPRAAATHTHDRGDDARHAATTAPAALAALSRDDRARVDAAVALDDALYRSATALFAAQRARLAEPAGESI